jgi:uncharacterized protein (TIGR03437 family)
MKTRIFKSHLTFAGTLLLLSAAAHADIINSTLNVTASGPFGATGITATGTASLTGVNGGTNGQFTANLSFTSFDQSGNLVAPFEITFPGGKLSGTLKIDPSILGGTGTAKGSATITGGTGTYAGWTGTFASLTGTGGLAGTTVSFQFNGTGTLNTAGGGSSTATPIVTTVASAADYSTDIAQGSLFIVKGSNLSGNGLVSASFPLPQSSGGSSITFTPRSGGTGTQAYIIYTYNQGGVNQIAAVLPSTVAPGAYNVTVTVGTVTSAPFQANVVQRHFAMFTQDASGSGLAVVQNFISATQYDVNRFTKGSISGITISPGHPGQAMIAWGTGLGPVTGGDNTAAAGGSLGQTVLAVVGGKSIATAYAGRAPGLASVDQIVFTLPSDVQTGCTVPFQISVNGTLSAPTFISIAPAGSDACQSPLYTTAQLQEFDNGKTLTSGSFQLFKFTDATGNVSNNLTASFGAFAQYTGFQLAGISTSTNSITNFPVGTCYVSQIQQTTDSTGASGTAKLLDAGNVTLNGPTGSGISNLAYQKLLGSYYLDLSKNANIVAGTYTLTGAGGPDVAAFNAQVTLPNPLTVTGGLPATVNRNSGLPIAWTGGNANDLVYISGDASTRTTSGTTVTVTGASFICLTNAGAGNFTVPSSILTQLPAVAASASNGSTALTVASIVNPTASNGTFTFKLVSDGSTQTGSFLSYVGTTNTPTYQ